MPNGIKCILDNGRPVTDQLEIANKFNDFFINITPSLTKNMPTTRNHNYGKYLTSNILSSFQFDLVDDDTVAKTLHSMKSKSSSGHDGISTTFDKSVAGDYQSIYDHRHISRQIENCESDPVI